MLKQQLIIANTLLSGHYSFVFSFCHTSLKAQHTLIPQQMNRSMDPNSWAPGKNIFVYIYICIKLWSDNKWKWPQSYYCRSWRVNWSDTRVCRWCNMMSVVETVPWLTQHISLLLSDFIILRFCRLQQQQKKSPLNRKLFAFCFSVSRFPIGKFTFECVVHFVHSKS